MKPLPTTIAFVVAIGFASFAAIAHAHGGSKASVSSTAHSSNASLQNQQRQQQMQQQMQDKAKQMQDKAKGTAKDKSYFGQVGKFFGEDSGSRRAPSPAISRQRCRDC
jgi:Flp pilus assembly protein TadB